MSVNAHLIDYRFPSSVPSLIHLDQKRFAFLIPLDWIFGLFSRRMGWAPAVLICLTWPLVALSQEIDEGEFSRKMLGHKLELLENEFEQSKMRFLTGSVPASRAKKLEQVYSELKYLETEFRLGRYYPDLFDEQIVIIREELRLILADPAKSTSMSDPGLL
jgi:hypothetical protein